MFSRFLELYLVSASHAGCTVGIPAATFAVQKGDPIRTRVGDMVMRTGASDIQGRGHRGRIRPDARLKRARKSQHRWIDLEGLESRTLLGTIPAATATGAPVNLTNLSDTTTGGNAISPTVAIDPYDSQKLLAVWGVDLSTLSPAPHTTAI